MPGRCGTRIVWIHLDTPARLHGPLLAWPCPLPADEAARLESVRAIQRTLILGSGSLALIFAIVLPALVARRLAAPIRGLARARPAGSPTAIFRPGFPYTAR